MSDVGNLEASSPQTRQLAYDWPLSLFFDLPLRSTTVVAGAYTGRVMELIAALQPTAMIYGFEPQQWAADRARERMQNNLRAMVCPFGVGVEDALLPMGEYNTDAASFVATGEGTRVQGTGRIYEILSTFQKLHIDHLDLFVMNMEGYEFQLVPHMIDVGMVEYIDRLAIQWHLGLHGTMEQTQKEMDDHIGSLAETHNLVVDQRPAWTYHERKRA